MLSPVHRALAQPHSHSASCSLYIGALCPGILSWTESRPAGRPLASALLAEQPFICVSLSSSSSRHCLHLQEVIDGEKAESDLSKNWLHIKAWIGLRPCRNSPKNVNLWNVNGGAQHCFTDTSAAQKESLDMICFNATSEIPRKDS